MDTVASMRATSEELIGYGLSAGADLRGVITDSTFAADGRWIAVWREYDCIKYNMQGSISLLPTEFQNSASSFHGSWSEAGSVTDLAGALALVKAWVIDRAEVDALPVRDRKRYGIG